MAKNRYKDEVDRWTTNGLGVQLGPMSAEKKKEIEALNKELAAEAAARRKKGAAKKKSK